MLVFYFLFFCESTGDEAGQAGAAEVAGEGTPAGGAGAVVQQPLAEIAVNLRIKVN